jgi:Oxidoreductase family, NAD-binding Rossmann fold
VFRDHEQLVIQPDIDVVAVTVKVPHHRELVTAALAAGKAVYCEWPLGRHLDEARAMAALAAEKGVRTVVVFCGPMTEWSGWLAEEGHDRGHSTMHLLYLRQTTLGKKSNWRTSPRSTPIPRGWWRWRQDNRLGWVACETGGNKAVLGRCRFQRQTTKSSLDRIRCSGAV